VPSQAIRALAAISILTFACGGPPPDSKGPERSPNVILVMTDDQGYGDIHSLGNTRIQTPNLDRLRAESIRLTNFHVDPTCSPTRSALMTGKYSSRTGVWHTIMGRSILHRDEITLGNLFSGAGYRTAMFGKWHLGDSYPYRPEQRGFQEVVSNGGGGVGQTPDYWGNDYFDDTYWHNGQPTKYEGYCTDVFFGEALKFIEANRDREFFVYLPTNAAHAPYRVPESYSQPYKDQGVPSPMAEFYGMITNIDDNMGRLVEKLKQLGLEENTILIFMTDNGTSAGFLPDAQAAAARSAATPGGAGLRPAQPSPDQPAWKGFNAGMRGIKGSEYEGGHRVPFFLRWPAGNLGPPRDIASLTAHIDVMPTLAQLCQLDPPEGVDWDGRSLAPLLRSQGEWPQRTLTVHSQRIEHPEKWRKSAVMTERWRLINGAELYDMQSDPGESNDIAAGNAEIVQQLRGEYETWWAHISDRFDEQVPIVIGAEQEPETRITAHDWHAESDAQVPWNQQLIQKNPYANGYWAIEVARDGTYQFDLYQRDKPANFPIEAAEARLTIGGAEAIAQIPAGATSVTLTAELKAGRTQLQTWLTDKTGKSRGAFYVYASRQQ
jgi:arylsulfatase A-like enzyme